MTHHQITQLKEAGVWPEGLRWYQAGEHPVVPAECFFFNQDGVWKLPDISAKSMLIDCMTESLPDGWKLGPTDLSIVSNDGLITGKTSRNWLVWTADGHSAAFAADRFLALYNALVAAGKVKP